MREPSVNFPVTVANAIFPAYDTSPLNKWKIYTKSATGRESSCEASGLYPHGGSLLPRRSPPSALSVSNLLWSSLIWCVPQELWSLHSTRTLAAGDLVEHNQYHCSVYITRSTLTNYWVSRPLSASLTQGCNSLYVRRIHFLLKAQSGLFADHHTYW